MDNIIASDKVRYQTVVLERLEFKCGKAVSLGRVSVSLNPGSLLKKLRWTLLIEFMRPISKVDQAGVMYPCKGRTWTE